MHRYRTKRFSHNNCFCNEINIPLRNVFYRTYKLFGEAGYLNDLLCAPVQVCEIVYDPDNSYWFVERLLSAVINEDAPVECKTITYFTGTITVLYMNGEPRRNIT